MSPGPSAAPLLLGAPSLGLQDTLSLWFSSVPCLSHRLPYYGTLSLQPPGCSGQNRGGGIDSSCHTSDPTGSPVSSVSRRAPESDHVSSHSRPERPSALSPGYCTNPVSRLPPLPPQKSILNSSQSDPVKPCPLTPDVCSKSSHDAHSTQRKS